MSVSQQSPDSEHSDGKPETIRTPRPTTPIHFSTNLPPDIESRAAAELKRRHYCVWIANPCYHRCPRAGRTGEACWCAFPRGEDWSWWPWRVLPPIWRDDAATGDKIARENDNGKA